MSIIKAEFNKLMLLICLCIILFMNMCKKDNDTNNLADGYLAEVSTIAISNLTQTTVVTGGIVNSNGGSVVTSRGVCWSTQAQPTIDDNAKIQGSGLGNFTCELTGLNHSTLYYLRAFATNKKGTAYGNTISFTTRTPIFFSGSAIIDIEGNSYNTIILGTQHWMSENLKTSKYRNGDIIPNGLSYIDWANTTEGACAIYNNDTVNNSVYGKLYNWYATYDSRGICPTGWHVPTDDDWTTLSNYILSYTNLFSIIGGTMKTTGTFQWAAPNTGANNMSGFSALPAGWMEIYNNYNFTAQTYVAAFWSCSENGNADGWYRMLNNNSTELSRYASDKHYGMSLRCIKE